jgi:sigma-B regulation protein RsbU (phosphoserine phosphatase)
MKKILNIGVTPANSDALNRKIRINNLISFISASIMIGYIPLAIYFSLEEVIVLNVLFLCCSCLSFYLNSRGKYNASFYIGCMYGLVYFVYGALLYGLAANLHFFILIICLLAIALFESTLILRIFLGLSVASFFILLLCLENKPGLIVYTEAMSRVQHVVAILNLFFLFFVTILFFIFFRRDNLLYQKAIMEQKSIIEEKQKEILDSINYAKRIQFSLLAGDTLLKEHLPEHFVLFQPKDVVSGDFYWAAPVSDGFMYITADCTGHGVPGAFMSLLNISKLSQVINENKVTRPDLVLNAVRSEIIHALGAHDPDGENKDGMDAILCKLNVTGMSLEYAAANNPFYIVRNKALMTCKADKMPVGKGHDDTLSFTYHQVELYPGDVIYTLTDGFADQFGGPRGKKFKYKALEELLLSIHDLPMAEQQTLLQKTLADWKGLLEQVDDVLIIGVRV